jgi:hypothetical protein
MQFEAYYLPPCKSLLHDQIRIVQLKLHFKTGIKFAPSVQVHMGHSPGTGNYEEHGPIAENQKNLEW